MKIKEMMNKVNAGVKDAMYTAYLYPTQKFVVKATKLGILTTDEDIEEAVIRHLESRALMRFNDKILEGTGISIRSVLEEGFSEQKEAN